MLLEGAGPAGPSHAGKFHQCCHIGQALAQRIPSPGLRLALDAHAPARRRVAARKGAAVCMQLRCTVRGSKGEAALLARVTAGATHGRLSALERAM